MKLTKDDIEEYLKKVKESVRRIDDLGRVVIPKEIRKVLRIKEGRSIRNFYR